MITHKIAKHRISNHLNTNHVSHIPWNISTQIHIYYINYFVFGTKYLILTFDGVFSKYHITQDYAYNHKFIFLKINDCYKCCRKLRTSKCRFKKIAVFINESSAKSRTLWPNVWSNSLTLTERSVKLAWHSVHWKLNELWLKWDWILPFSSPFGCHLVIFQSLFSRLNGKIIFCVPYKWQYHKDIH